MRVSGGSVNSDDVTSREGRVSRNKEKAPGNWEIVVTSREGRVSRNYNIPDNMRDL